MNRNKVSFAEKYGPWAFIAGASEGIGEAFAREAAKRGINVIMAARRIELLEKLAVDISEQYSVDVIPLRLDLTGPDLLKELKESAGPFDIGLVVYNAALSTIGEFAHQPMDLHNRVIDLNCRGPVTLCSFFGGTMKAKKRGAIILMSSLTGFQGSPWVSHYGATKAYNLTLAEGLWHEFRQHGVTVMACVAGATRTPAYLASSSNSEGLFRPPEMDPSDVARQALEALPKGKPFMVPGRNNRISSWIMRRLMTRKMAVTILGKANRRLLIPGKKK